MIIHTTTFFTEGLLFLLQKFSLQLTMLCFLLCPVVQVMMFDCQRPEQQARAVDSYVVVDPHGMCHDMNKAILSPDNFPGSHLIFPDHGVIEESKLDDALRQTKVEPSAGKALLQHAKVCTPNPCQPKLHFFPIHVKNESAPPNAWAEDRTNGTKPQAAVQVHCSDIPFSPAYLPTLQLDLSNESANGITEDSLVWRTGMVVEMDNNVSVLVCCYLAMKVISAYIRANHTLHFSVSCVLSSSGHGHISNIIRGNTFICIVSFILCF